MICIPSSFLLSFSEKEVKSEKIRGMEQVFNVKERSAHVKWVVG